MSKINDYTLTCALVDIIDNVNSFKESLEKVGISFDGDCQIENIEGIAFDLIANIYAMTRECNHPLCFEKWLDEGNLTGDIWEILNNNTMSITDKTKAIVEPDEKEKDWSDCRFCKECKMK